MYEINLASESILQCIEQSLDSKILSIELNGCSFEEYKMHENFCLIATQNPKEGFYSNKRKEHSYRLLSRFQIIRFDEIDDKILEKIALGLEKRFSGNNNNNNINISNLIKIHNKWKNENNNKDNPICYTIRQISAVIKCLCDNNISFNELIMKIYGSSYNNNKKEKLKKIIEEETKTKFNNKVELKTPSFGEKCLYNNILSETYSNIVFSLNNNRNTILIGEEGLKIMIKIIII